MLPEMAVEEEDPRIKFMRWVCDLWSMVIQSLMIIQMHKELFGLRTNG